MNGRKWFSGLLLLVLLATTRIGFSTEPRVDLQPLDCTREPWVRSVEATTPTTIEFVNPTSHVRKVYWLDYSGQRQLPFTLQPGQTAGSNTFFTHAFVVTDTNGQCLAVFVAGTSPGRAALPDAPIEPAGVRSMVDQPDDSPGYQIHVMYVLPSDGVDQKLDIDGAIADSVASGQNWFIGQTGGRWLRFDTYRGKLDVTFYRLPQSDAQIRTYGAYDRDHVEYELAAAGFDQPGKIYAVYYGGTSPGCGGACHPPELLGTVGMIFLLGTPPGAPPCANDKLALADEAPRYLEFAMFHEILHTLGMVPGCAPHHTTVDPFHVNDDPRDIMYAGPLHTPTGLPSILDVGHDDYFEHHNAGCLDLAKSIYLDPPTADAAPPPGGSYVELQPVDCGREPSLRSIEGTTKTVIQFINASSQVRKVYWIDYNGQRQASFTLQPWDAAASSTFLANPFAVTDLNDRCLAIYLPASQPGRVIIRE